MAVGFKSPLPGAGAEYPEYKDTAYRRSSIRSSTSSSCRVRRYHPGEDGLLARACLQINQMNTPEAYERLIGARIPGKPRVVFQWDQIETKWELCDSIRKMYAERGSSSISDRQGAMGLGGRPPA